MTARWCLCLAIFWAAACAGQGNNLIRNGGFDHDTDGWSFWFAPGQAAGHAVRVPRAEGGALQVSVDRRDTASSVQIYNGPFAIRKGQKYVVQFEARADKPFSMPVRLMGNDPPYGTLGLDTEVPITTEWRTYTLSATASHDSAAARLDFFPSASFMLDNVAVRPSGADSNVVVHPRQIRLGPGWNGNPASLTDGDPHTRVNSSSYAVLPLLVTMDLGEPQPVAQVTVSGFDFSAHVFTDRMSVEVSADGIHWHKWARASKTPAGAPVRAQQTTFTASSLVVNARYLRLRVDRVHNVAVLSEVRVEAAAGGAAGAVGVSPDVLPAVNPLDDVAFLGWDYARLGYAASPGERVALRWSNQGDAPVDVPVAWQLDSYAGDELAHGSAALHLPATQQAEVPIALPASLADGPKKLVCRLGAGDAAREEPFYFDYRTGTGDRNLDLHVVALMDNDDPEGWARMLAGPLRRHIVAYADFPSDAVKVDAALVAAEAWGDKEPRVQELRSYLQTGGAALVFGRPAPGLADMVPVVVDAKAPWMDHPSPLEKLTGPAALWRDFDPAKGPQHYGIRVTAKPGAEVLARWSDGTPAVVIGNFGKGRVAYVGTGSGQIWTTGAPLSSADELALRLLYHLAGRDDAIPAMLRQAKDLADAEAAADRAALDRVWQGQTAPRPEHFVATGRHDVGRFGWTVGEGGLVENISDSGEMTCPADTHDSWAVRPHDCGDLRGRVASENWLSKTIEWRDNRGVRLHSTVSLGSPMILWEGDATELELTGRDMLHAAFATAAGVHVVSAADGTVSTEGMSANWLVLFDGRADVRETPRLVVLTHRPRDVKILDEGVTLRFAAGGFGALWTGHLWGLRRLAPGAAAAWQKAFPMDAAGAAKAWGHACLRYPVDADEIAWTEGSTVNVADRFRFRAFTDDWNTPATTKAPLPPMLSLAARNHVPVSLPGDHTDTAMATKYGPLEAVAGDRVVYRITLPPHDHFGVIPTRGQQELQPAIDHYALDGIGSVTRASGGLTSGSDFVEDLRAYMSSDRFTPFAAPCIDLYKWWYCFPTILARPAYTAETRDKVDAHYREQYRTTLNYYTRKCFVRYRREPWTGEDYAISFIWPVHVRDGVRYFVDQNESAAVIAYCLESYARYYGDWTTVSANWNLMRWLLDYLPRFHDWALMCSSNQEFFNTVGIDMLNSEYPGNLAMARMAHEVGDRRTEERATVLAAQSLVPAVARFFLPAYVQSITAEGDPWRRSKFYFSMSDTGIGGAEKIDMRGGPESIMGLAIGFLDTSKGTSPEMTLAYKAWALREINAYEQTLHQEEIARRLPVGWAHLMQRAMLGWKRDDLIATAGAFDKVYANWGWQSTKAPGNMAVVDAIGAPLFLADWEPAGYVGGEYDPDAGTATLQFENEQPASASVRLYSQRAVTAVAVDSKTAAGWKYDAASGWLTFSLAGAGPHTVVVHLGALTAPPHPYFAVLGRG